MKKLLSIRKVLTVLLLLLPFFLFSQTYIVVSIDQPEALIAYAGDDMTIHKGDTIQLGGFPAAEGGGGAYTYSWSPSDGVDDVSSSNPTVIASSELTYTLTVTDLNECSASDEVAISFDTSDFIWEGLSNLPEMTIYPNPANNRITLLIKNANGLEFTIHLIDATGSTVFSEDYNNQREIILPPDNIILSKGIYFLIMRNTAFSVSKKLIIQ